MEGGHMEGRHEKLLILLRYNKLKIGYFSVVL